jgi:hypothetical protein
MNDHPQVFDGRDVFREAVAAPDGYTVAELARRRRELKFLRGGHLSESPALNFFLRGFERAGRGRQGWLLEHDQ